MFFEKIMATIATLALLLGALATVFAHFVFKTEISGSTPTENDEVSSGIPH